MIQFRTYSPDTSRGKNEAIFSDAIFVRSRKDNSEFVGSSFRLLADNYFITAAHCVEDTKANEIEVLDASGRRVFPCVNVQFHPDADLAVVEVSGDVSPNLIAPFK